VWCGDGRVDGARAAGAHAGWKKIDLKPEQSGNGCTLLDKVELMYEG
jgi:hypothetical protein